MENEMMERVEQLEEKVKRLEGELSRTMEARKTSNVRRRTTVFNIWRSCSRADYRFCNLNSYLDC
ncbi:hypothetical protein ICW_04295 [Bacillus wiedmannii]|nr:hypothetical protein ICW_04295 [Bacillus wiedmannii]EJV67377.1 hypothetical protein IEO_00931 [Bacillus wiedmannii]OFD11596.1 hypothetical protein BTGOE6_07690 [Bacillus wiedmannii]